MKLLKATLTALQSVLALLAGLMVVVLVNVAAARMLDALLPGSLNAEGLPLTPLAQGLYLPILFLAGMAGAFLVVFGAPRAPLAHGLIFGGIALLGDVLVVRDYVATWAVWFSVLVVATVPLQVWLGVVLGLRARRRWAPWASEVSPAASGNPLVTPPQGQPPAVGRRQP
jgi:hypothetical protein